MYRFIGLIAFMLTNCAGSTTVILEPGDDIQAAINAAPVGSLFILEPGIYRQQNLIPKDGQRFIGRSGAILNGAMLLSGWQKEGSLWARHDLPEPLRPRGRCLGKSKICKYREDLFLDDRLYRRVASLKELGPGKWFYWNGVAYLTDDPIGQQVELSVTSRAVGGDASGVLLENIVIEKYASAAQRGAIDGRNGRDWNVIDVTARWNHGVGLFIGENMRVSGGAFIHNGQMGMGGDGDGAIIANVEIAYNNYAAFSWIWEAGGTKFVRSNGLVIRQACVHHNVGPGLWTDIDNFDIIYDGNKVFENKGDGIKHEISYKAVIRNNIVARNGRDKDNWQWGSQILIQNSPDVEVHGNFVEIAAEYGNGISIINQDRGVGKYGPLVATGNNIHHNRIIHLGKHGRSGIVTDFTRGWFWNNENNRFDWNIYTVPSKKAKRWTFNDRRLRWAQVQASKFEANGTLRVARSQPTELSCGPKE